MLYIVFGKSPAQKMHIALWWRDTSQMNFQRHVYTYLMRPLSYVWWFIIYLQNKSAFLSGTPCILYTIVYNFNSPALCIAFTSACFLVPLFKTNSLTNSNCDEIWDTLIRYILFCRNTIVLTVNSDATVQRFGGFAMQDKHYLFCFK